uniref:Receptor-interacting serine/threonine-protein kinase 2 n=1 Tax=Leptobrachium leishanense TaxID=445787 RepID=A0A8C5PU21_9ANUR
MVSLSPCSLGVGFSVFSTISRKKNTTLQIGLAQTWDLLQSIAHFSLAFTRMSSSGESRGSSSSSSSSAGGPLLSREENPNIIHPATISSSLECIPYDKLKAQTFINKGAYGTVHSAFHEDWRVQVAVKYFPAERHLVERERIKILKEAEILHKARFSYILPILGICNENAMLGIVTEYMTNGSLNQLLHDENPSLEIAWPLRFRILYEIALGVNFLHNMSPPLLHHDLKTQNILLDNEFHCKIADFGLSKWRMLSSSHSFSDQTSPAGTIVYMPPEEYEPSIKNRRGSVKHDMYSYAVIMWEVLTRKHPFEGATTPMQIMFTVAKGKRPDISEESLPLCVPHREVFVSLMQNGWATDPNERPAFLKCLLELEPVVTQYDDITILEGILQIKRVWRPLDYSARLVDPPHHCQVRTNVNRCLRSPASEVLPEKADNDLRSSNEDIYGGFRVTTTDFYAERSLFPGTSTSPFIDAEDLIDIRHSSPAQESSSLAHQWVQDKRTEIINQMTEACLNQCLDALISRKVILKEDYEQIKAQPTRCSKVRQLIDTSDIQGDTFSRILVEKLRENRQNDLMPFPEF